MNMDAFDNSQRLRIELPDIATEDLTVIDVEPSEEDQQRFTDIFQDYED